MNVSTVRAGLNRLLEDWRSARAVKPIFVGVYGSPEAVIAPVAVWLRLLAAAAEAWDLRTAASRSSRLTDPTGARSTTLVELAQKLGVPEAPLPVLQSRGVPRGAADLAVWPAAVEDLRAVAAVSAEATLVAVVTALADLLQGKAVLAEACGGAGMVRTVTDVDGLHAIVLVSRRVVRPAGRRGGGARPLVELVAADRLDWAPPGGLEPTAG
ncbi:MAG: hypothetical protein JXA67_12160 [Micromonosporaceae bacterium]|nr:hypothetical protein [Micromonosporaceae bacterium]